MVPKKVVEAIKRNKRFLITSHINMEGDALGSSLAMRGLLLALGKKAMIINADRVPKEYKFLPGLKYINPPQKARGKKFDCFIAVDCSDAGRCREVFDSFSKEKVVINIDHHISNSKFGDLNWVDPRFSSTAEMIYQLYKRMDLALDKDKALWLYAGLVTDTGSFRYPNTNSLTHKIVSELMGYGILADRIYRRLYENIQFSDLVLLSKIFLTLRQTSGGRIIWFEIKGQLLKDKRSSFDLTEKVLNFGRLNKEAQVIVLFREDPAMPGQVRINLRSNNQVDVNKIAKFFNGGGHKNASGCRVKGSLEKVKARVLKKIKDVIG